MEHTGHVRIDRKNIPYHLIDDKVSLIPNNAYSMLFPSEIKHKKIIKGITTGNRNVQFLNCRYNANSLSYQVMIISESNTGMYNIFEGFDRICFEGIPVNVFAGPGEIFVSEDGYDISKRILAITSKEWDKLNIKTNTKIKSENLILSVDYTIHPNKRYAETSIGEAIPRFCIEYEKTQNISKIPEMYLMAYDFFAFLNFRRNIKFDKIYIQKKIEGKFETIARVFVKSNNWGKYTNTENNSIVLNDIKDDLGSLFKSVVTRRQNKIYDNFFIPCNDEENLQISYEAFLSCALSFESEYSRTYPSKKEEKEKYAYLQKLFIDSAEKLNEMIILIEGGHISKDDFEKMYFGMINPLVMDKLNGVSKTQGREYKGYYENIVDTLSKLDFSLGEKYKKALAVKREIVNPVIERVCSANNIVFPSEHEAGKIFSLFRNGIAHGNPEEIQEIHWVLYVVARALIYALVLSNSGVEEDKIKSIVNKLF